MRIGCEDMNFTLIQHFLGPVLWFPPEATGQGTAGDLHPNPGLEQPLDGGVLPFDPSQPLRMRENRHVPSHDDTEEEILDACRRHMMRRFDQHIARIGQGQQSP